MHAVLSAGVRRLQGMSAGVRQLHWRLTSSPQMAATMRAAQFQPGGPEKLGLGEVPMPTLRSGEVLIKVHATAINRADTLQRKGLYPPPPGESDILGLEAAGTVERLGPDCGGRWKPGDRVMALLAGLDPPVHDIDCGLEGLSYANEAALKQEVFLIGSPASVCPGTLAAGSWSAPLEEQPHFLDGCLTSWKWQAGSRQ